MIDFANPWGLLALAAIPAILAIHLFRRRYPFRTVAGLFLWRGMTRPPDSGRVWDRLPWSWSLLLELLAALLLALILAQPRLATGRAAHLVVVVDSSASTGARLSAGGTIRRQFIDEIERRLDALGSDAVATIIATGRRPALVGGGSDWPAVRQALEQLPPGAADHDPAEAWSVGAQIAKDEAALLYLSDGPVDDARQKPARMESVWIGQANPNLALSSARWDAGAGEDFGQILGHVSNYSDNAANVEIIATSRGTRQFSVELAVPAGQTRSFEHRARRGTGQIELQLFAKRDFLEVDNLVRLIEPRQHVVRIANRLGDDHPAAEPIERALSAVAGIEPVATGNEADLVISSAAATAPDDPRCWWLAIGTAEQGDKSSEMKKGTDEPSVLVVDHQSPLLAGVTFEGVATPESAAPHFDGTPLVSRGAVPVLVRRSGGGGRHFGLNIDFAKSNLAKSPDWPIFMHNLIGRVRGDRPGPHRWNFRTGEPIEFRLPRSRWQGEQPLSLAGPGTDRPVSRGPVVEFVPPDRPGVYRLLDGPDEIGRFAVNLFDAGESDLRDRRSGGPPEPRQSQPRGVRIDSLHSWLMNAAILGALCGLIGNWYLLSRRRREIRRAASM